MDVVIIGGGGHAKSVIGLLRRLEQYRMVGYTDSSDKGLVAGIPWIGSDDVLIARGLYCGAVIGVGQIGSGESRCRLWTRLKTAGLAFPAIVSPSAVVDPTATCGEGTVVMHGAVINVDARIGTGVIVNTNSTVEHDVSIADWVHVAPGATICGGVQIGRFSMIGAGATVIEGKAIGEGCFVGSGATVVRDLAQPGIYVGSPARRIG